MANTEKNQRKHNKNSPVRYLLLMLILGAAVYIFLPRITNIDEAIKVLRSMSLWIVFLAAIAEICSYLGSGYLLKVIVSIGKSKFSILQGVLITLAAASMGLLMGGFVTVAATTYYWVSRCEGISEESKLTGFLPTLYNTILFLILAGFGLFYLLVIHNLSNFETAAYIAMLIFYVIAILVILYGFRHREIVERFVFGIINFFTHLLKRKHDQTVVRETIADVYTGLKLMGKKGWKKPASGACMNVGFDILALYFLFLAAGYPINPIFLIVGYGMMFLIRTLVFFIPGGVGVVESGMLAIYTSLGVPAGVGVIVILSYRIFSFWLPSLIGFAVTIYLGRTLEKGQ